MHMRPVGLHPRCPWCLPHEDPHADDEAGETLGYILEEQARFFSMLRRQPFVTHRPFRAVINGCPRNSSTMGAFSLS